MSLPASVERTFDMIPTKPVALVPTKNPANTNVATFLEGGSGVNYNVFWDSFPKLRYRSMTPANRAAA